MLNVPIDRIVPLTDARDNFSRIVADIENQKDGLYVLTKGGKPAIALINISYLSELMNGTAVLPQPNSPAPEKKPAEVEVSEINKEPEVIKPKVEEKPEPVIEKKEEPKVTTPPAPINPINPTWTGQQPAPVAKPASPWPIVTNTPAPTPPLTMNAPKPPISAPPPPPPKPPVPPPPPPMPKPAPVPVPPAPVAVVPPPPPSNPMVAPIPVPIKTTPDLPPPPNNPTTIPFDEAPKTMLEPGEESIIPTPTPTPAAPSTPAPAPTTPPSAPAAPTNTSVQDIDI